MAMEDDDPKKVLRHEAFTSKDIRFTKDAWNKREIQVPVAFTDRIEITKSWGSLPVLLLPLSENRFAREDSDGDLPYEMLWGE